MRTHLAIFFADCGNVAVLKTYVIKSSNLMGWLYWRLAAINVENRGNEFNRRYLTCQISAILNADRGDGGDRRIKSPSVSLALSYVVSFRGAFKSTAFVSKNSTCRCMATLFIGLPMVFAFTSPKFKTFKT